MRRCRSIHFSSMKEKGPFATERPKSREETPKEGCEARAKLTYRTAKIKGAAHHEQMRFTQGRATENAHLKRG
jgi:hypothetical protein